MNVTWKAAFALVAAILTAAGMLGSGASADSPSADLAVSMTWVGNGTPRAKTNDFATYTIRMTNLGPGPAENALISAFGTDQFDLVSLNCSSTNVAFCTTGATLASGQTVTATLVEEVCCFPPGESRDASVTANVFTTTSDPDSANNDVSVATKITGPHN